MADLPPRAWPPVEDYHYLESVGRADVAWEWLRRDPEFHRRAPSVSRKAANGVTIIDAASLGYQARWGCLHVPDPEKHAIGTPILWSAAIDPSVLPVAAVPARQPGDPAFDIRRYAKFATLVLGSRDLEHLLLLGVGQGIRLDVVSGSLLDGPVTLRLDFLGSREIAPTLRALRRFLHLFRTGSFPDSSIASDRSTRRLIQALRVHDALATGASIRDVGLMLFGAGRIEAEWLAPGEALKSHCHRLIALSRVMASGGYKTLLS